MTKYVDKFWKGDIPLVQSFWIMGFIVGSVVGFLLGFIFLGTGLILSLFFQIYLLVGIWKSADKYKGEKAWAILAKLAMILGIANILNNIIN